jgi:hypothetical protein
MGNPDIRKLFEKYLRDNGLAINKEKLRRPGSTYDEALGEYVELISDCSRYGSGETIAAALLDDGIYPAIELVESINLGDRKIEDVKRRFREIREKWDYDMKDATDAALGYSLLRADAVDLGVRLDLDYKEFLTWLKGEKDYPVLAGAPTMAQKHLDELYYLSVEANGVEKEIVKAARRAREISRPFIVIGNNTYGGQVALAPILDSLKRRNIKVLLTRVPSGNVHHNPYYVPSDIFNETELKFMLNEKPVIFIVDGTNSMRGTVLEGLKRRFREPHFPDSYLGFRNYFLALQEALGSVQDGAIQKDSEKHETAG